MPNLNAPNITVAITAIDETSPELNRAKQNIQNFSTVGRTAGDGLDYSLQKARESARGLGEEIGVRLPRFVSTFIAESRAIGPALSAAFSAIAVIGLVEVLSRIPSAIDQITNKIAGWDDAAKKLLQDVAAQNKLLLEQKDRLQKINEERELEGLKGVALYQKQLEIQQRHTLTIREQRDAAIQTREAYEKLIADFNEQTNHAGPIPSKASEFFASLADKANIPLFAPANVKQATDGINEVTNRIGLLNAQLQVSEAEGGLVGDKIQTAMGDEATRKVANLNAEFAKQKDIYQTIKIEIAKVLDPVEAIHLKYEKLRESAMHVAGSWETILKLTEAENAEVDALHHKQEEVARKTVEDLTKGKLPQLVPPPIVIPRPQFDPAQTDALTAKIQRIHEVVDGLSQGFDQLFTGIAQGSRSMADVLKGVADAIVASIGHILTRMLAVYLLQKLLGGVSGGINVGSPGSGTVPIPISPIPLVPIPHASGGPVIPGMPYLVGEHGPELFVSGRAGQIVPNGGFGGASVQVNIINQSSQPVNASVSQPKFDGEKYVIGVVLKDFSQNGPLRKALGSR